MDNPTVRHYSCCVKSLFAALRQSSADKAAFSLHLCCLLPPKWTSWPSDTTHVVWSNPQYYYYSQLISLHLHCIAVAYFHVPMPPLPFNWLLPLLSNAPIIKQYKPLRPGLIHYDHLFILKLETGFTNFEWDLSYSMICLDLLTTVYFWNCMTWYQVISTWLVNGLLSN